MRPFESGAIAAFASELQDTLPQIDASLDAASVGGDQDPLREAHRLLHSLKGAAGMVGLPAFGYLLNLAEDLVERSLVVAPESRVDLLATLRGCLPQLTSYATLAARGSVGAVAPMAAALIEQLRGDAAAIDDATFDKLLDLDVRELAAARPEPKSQAPESEPAAPANAPAVEAVALLPAETLDDLLAALPDLATDAMPAAVEAEGASLLDALATDWPQAFALSAEPSEPIEPVDTAPPRAPMLGPSALEVLPTEDDVPSEDVPPELAEVFAQEAAEHLQTIARVTSRLSPTAEDREALQDLRRAVHTLKGAAGVVGYRTASRLAHVMEDLLDRLYDGTDVLTPNAVRLLASASDALDESINGASDASQLRTTIARLMTEFGALSGMPAVVTAPQSPPASTMESPADSTPVRPAAAPDRRSGTDRRSGGQVLRVPVGRLDDLVRVVSELVLNRSTFEQHYSALLAQVEELKFSAARIRKVAQKLEADYEVRALAGNSVSNGGDGFDALEFDRYTDFHLLTRELTETASDVATVSTRIGDSIDDFESDLTRLGRLTREIQDKTLEFRMLPLRTLTTRLERTVRVTADACGKRVELTVEGEDVTLDKSLLEHMADPLLHLLRNAVDHGIESSELRLSSGKPAHGRIVVRAFHDGTDVVIEVEDDGKGLDVERIRRTAVDRGLVSPADAATLAPEALFDYIFEPGFSTASRVSEISGRGVGMDVVKSAVVRAGGRIQVDSRPGAGVTISVRAPMTLAITRVLLVRAGGETFGLPLGAVIQIVRPHPTAISQVGADRVLTVDGRAHRLRDLADVLGLARSPDAPATQPVLIANLSGRRVALAVDAILHSRDAVVKSLGSHLRRVPGMWGATLLGDGTVVLILNAADLNGAAEDGPVRVVSRPAQTAVEPRARTVLVVDDSLSMRHVLSMTLKKAGWNVLQARDGLDALEVVHRAARTPDAILLDIEMPRMDGYEFLSTIRAHPAYAALPIVMLTSRGSDKHRDKANALGASGYLVKPFKEDVLTETIARLVQAGQHGKAAS